MRWSTSVLVMAGVLFGVAACGSAEADSAQGTPGAVCAPGMNDWLAAAAVEPVMVVPAGATAVRRTAIANCAEYPLIGNVSQSPPRVAMAIEFSSEDSDEQIINGLRNAAGTNDWRDSDIGPSAGCMVKVIEGSLSFLLVRAGDEGNYSVEIARADPEGCRRAADQGN